MYPNDYNDGLIHLHIIDEFCMNVLVNRDGDCKTISYDDNFFHISDLPKAYAGLWRDDWYIDGEKPAYVDRFKNWLIESGYAEKEDFE